MRRRWVSSTCLSACLLVLGWGACWVFAERRYQAGLRWARADITGQRFEAARRRLAAQSIGRPEHAEAAYLLGVCEQALGRPAAAAAAYARVPLHSSSGLEAFRARAKILIDDLGRFDEAEAVITEALAGAGRSEGAAPVRYTFSQLLYWEGRLDEMRRLYQEAWLISPARISDLHELWMIDNAALMFEKVQAAVEKAARLAPDDDRVWLARANMAVQAGRFAEARRWLDACVKRRPDDPVVWRARLRLALAADRLDEVRQTAARLLADRFSITEVLTLRAWIAAHEAGPEAERTALDLVVDRFPGDTRALERLATLASGAGESERAAELRRRKAEAHLTKERYYRLMEAPGPITRFAELGCLADKLGLDFAARAWWLLAAQRRPSDVVAAASVARLGPPRPEPHPAGGQTLAAVLVDRDPIAGGPALAGSGSGGRSPAPEPTARALTVPVFRDDAETAGLRFVFRNGRSRLRQLPEDNSGGVALLDYDGDGWLDVYVVQGGVFPPSPARPSSGDRLFHNRGDGTFEDASERSGIARLSRGYGHGVTAGDFDNDGRPDLFLTRWQSYALFRNRGDGTFEDVSAGAGLGGDRDWPTSAAFADLDNDGDLDLYVCHYLVWNSEHPTLCPRPTKPGEVLDPERTYDYCMPNPLPSRADHLFRNDGGRFVDVTNEAGITDPNGRGLGVVAADVDADGLTDLFIANDTTANYLFRNLGGLRFEERATSAGVACNAMGAFQAGMGAAVGDLDGDFLPDLLVTNFYGESTSFFKNLGNCVFADRTAAVGLAGPSRFLLGFGVVLFDANNDGRIDLATTNGHVVDQRPTTPFEMPGLLLIGGAEGKLVDVSRSAGEPWTTPRIGRGLAAGDIDNDGRIDLVAVPQNSPLVYFHNQAPGGRSVTFELEGVRSNKAAVGAVVTIEAGGRRQRAWVHGGGSFQSASDPRIHFGLDHSLIEQVEVRWPSGRVDRFERLDVDWCYRLREGQATPTIARRFKRVAVPLRQGLRR